MTGHVKVAGAWKNVSGASVKVGGAWKTVSDGWTKIGGVWKKWLESGPPSPTFVSQSIGITAVKRSVEYLASAGYFLVQTPSTTSSGSGDIYRYSSTGQTGSWSSGSMPSSRIWGSMGASPTRLLAVAGFINTTSNFGAFTENGLTWTTTTMPSIQSWAGSYLNGYYVFVSRATSNQLAYSTTGESGSWSTNTIRAATSGLRAPAYGNGVYLVPDIGSARMMRATSISGSWSSTTLPQLGNWSAPAYYNGVWVAILPNLTTYAYSFDDGSTWTGMTLPERPGNAYPVEVFASTYFQGFFYAAASGQIWYSSDGVTWTSKGTPIAETEGRSYGWAESPSAVVFLVSAAGDTSEEYVWSAK